MAQKRTLKNLITELNKPRVRKGRIYGIDGGRVDVRPYHSPGLLRHVEVSGDASQLQLNQEVVIYWADLRPVVLAGVAVPSFANLSGLTDADTLDGLDSTDFSLASHGHAGIQVLGPNGAFSREYSPSPGGLQSALANAYEGYQIVLPPCTITHTFTLNTGVYLRGAGMGVSNILGVVAGGAGLSHLTVRNNTSSGSRQHAYSITGLKTLCHSVRFEVNNPAGPASAVVLNHPGEALLLNCEIALTSGGAMYGIQHESGGGITRMIGGRVEGTPAPFKDSI